MKIQIQIQTNFQFIWILCFTRKEIDISIWCHLEPIRPKTSISMKKATGPIAQMKTKPFIFYASFSKCLLWWWLSWARFLWSLCFVLAFKLKSIRDIRHVPPGNSNSKSQTGIPGLGGEHLQSIIHIICNASCWGC